MTTTISPLGYPTTKINNRRYLGNKYKLLPFITSVVRDNCRDIVSVADIFAGTGAVASAFSNKILITNDILYSNYICNLAWFGSQHFDSDKIIKYIVRYNAYDRFEQNYMTENYSNTYFSDIDCSKISISYSERETCTSVRRAASFTESS